MNRQPGLRARDRGAGGAPANHTGAGRERSLKGTPSMFRHIKEKDPDA